LGETDFFNGLLWQLDSESQLNVLQSLYTSNGAELRVMLEKGGAVSRWTPDRQKDQAKRTDKPKTVVKVPGGQGVITGTEYSIRVDENGRTALLVLEGEVELSADSGATIHVGENESAEMRPGSPPLKNVTLNALDRVQWATAYVAMPLRYAVNASARTRAILEVVGIMAADGRTEEAIQRLDSAMAQDDAEPALWLASSDLFLGAGGFIAARSRAAAGRQRFELDARFDALLARIALFEGRSDDSRVEAGAAVAKDPGGIEGWLSLGDWATREGRASIARRAFARATTLVQTTHAAGSGWGTWLLNAKKSSRRDEISREPLR